MQAVDLVVESLNAFHGAGALGLHLDVDHAGMVPARTHASSHAVGEPFSGAQMVEEPRGEAAAKHFVHHRHGEVIGIAALDAEVEHVDAALVYVALADRKST